MENFHCQPDKPVKAFPKITYELPEGDERSIKQWFIEATEDGYKVCLSIEENNAKEIWDASLPQNYQPKTISIPKLEVENIIDALKAGLEHTESVLIEHDNNLGRTTRKNELWAKQLEKDIEFIKSSLTFLKEKLVGATTHYP